MAGRRASQKSSERTLALTILGVGTAVSVASLVGDVWIVRAGLLIAVVMAFAAVRVAWRELKVERERHALEMKHEVALRSQQAMRFHEESVAMIGRFNARSENLQSVIAKLRSQLGSAKAELSSMRGNAVWLRAEVAERQSRIEALETRIAELEAEDTANIVDLPRRVSPSIEDIWGQDEHPTMVDLAKLNLDGLPALRQA
ncbi:hypothetical protein [Tessaracoccus sp. G1721]